MFKLHFGKLAKQIFKRKGWVLRFGFICFFLMADSLFCLCEFLSILTYRERYNICIDSWIKDKEEGTE